MKRYPVTLQAVPVLAIPAGKVHKKSPNLLKKKKLKNDKFEYNHKYQSVYKSLKKIVKCYFV